MNVEKLSMEQTEAQKLYKAYKESRTPLTKDDQAIAAIYKRLAQGKLVIRALASITAAGVDDEGLPKLAIMRADQREAHLQVRNDEMIFYSAQTHGSTARFTVPMPGVKYANWSDNKRYGRKAQVPLIPVHLRPRKGIQNYCILWEADWQAYPIDPYLLRRFGEDAWLVVAAWDLTAVERAVMSQQLNA